MLKRLNVSILVLALAFFAVSCANDKDQEVREAAVTAVTPQTTQPAATAANPNMVTPEQVTTPDGPTTAMTFEEMTYDFGTIDAGEKVRHVYSFTNTGDEPLVISNARGSCGCTVPQWPQEAIAPGADGEIVVEYNSKGKSGKETKTVTITANTMPAVTKLTITGTVNAAAPVGNEVQVVQ
ncbi:MAG: DUF1573 domain-containing protein [Bacteroidota bacterium]